MSLSENQKPNEKADVTAGSEKNTADDKQSNHAFSMEQTESDCQRETMEQMLRSFLNSKDKEALLLLEYGQSCLAIQNLSDALHQTHDYIQKYPESEFGYQTLLVLSERMIALGKSVVEYPSKGKPKKIYECIVCFCDERLKEKKNTKGPEKETVFASLQNQKTEIRLLKEKADALLQGLSDQRNDLLQRCYLDVQELLETEQTKKQNNNWIFIHMGVFILLFAVSMALLITNGGNDFRFILGIVFLLLGLGAVVSIPTRYLSIKSKAREEKKQKKEMISAKFDQDIMELKKFDQENGY